LQDKAGQEISACFFDEPNFYGHFFLGSPNFNLEERLASKGKCLFLQMPEIGFQNNECNRCRERLQDKAG
jgi:hypothetical protein